VSDRLLADGLVMSAMLREYFMTPLARSVEETTKDDLFTLLLSLFERGQARGEFRSSISPQLAVMTLLSISTVVLTGTVFPKETTREEARRQFFELLLSGIMNE